MKLVIFENIKIGALLFYLSHFVLPEILLLGPDKLMGLSMDENSSTRQKSWVMRMG